MTTDEILFDAEERMDKAAGIFKACRLAIAIGAGGPPFSIGHHRDAPPA